MINLELSAHRRQVEEQHEWRKWCDKMPMIPTLPRGWKFQPIPQFGGAVARFGCESPSGVFVSIYLDCYNELGIAYTEDDEPMPYWEVYEVDGGVARCRMEDVDTLRQ